VLLAAYAFSTRNHRHEVEARVTLAGLDIGGMNKAQLARTLERVAARYEGAQVRVKAPGGGFTTPASTLGLRVNRATTAAHALEVGRGGLPITRLWSWAYSFVTPRTAAVDVDVDRAAARLVIAKKDPGPHAPAVEPSIRFEDNHFVAVAGKAGRGIDDEDVATELSKAAGTGRLIAVSVGRETLRPRFGLAAARAVAREADRLIKAPLPLTLNGEPTTVSTSALRSWATAAATEGRLVFAIDGAKAATDLHKRYPRAGVPAAETTFQVVNGQVSVVPGHAGTTCCDPSVGGRIERVLRAQLPPPVEAPLRRIEPKISAEQAAQLGIKEVVGSFTTQHPAGQPRVKNIHRIADLMRGQVILPNSTMSVNAIIGKRTAAKGFVNAPVIEEGLFSEDFGGGVSQFATTLFNAGFLAGLEFPEYQSHSIYLSRYPYGREATLNYPHPDLKIRNNTPYGVLIWPSYTGSAVSVTLYSTKTWKVTQTGQTKSPQGVCTRVRTERTRVRLSDQLTKKDAVFATYRPAEGMNCDGTTNKTTTTLKATTTTKKPAAPTTTAKPAPTTAPATTAPPGTTTTAPPAP